VGTNFTSWLKKKIGPESGAAMATPAAAAPSPLPDKSSEVRVLGNAERENYRSLAL